MRGWRRLLSGRATFLPRGMSATAMNWSAKGLAMPAKSRIGQRCRRHRTSQNRDLMPIDWCAHPSVIVVPTVPMTNASGSRAAICWQALQPVQCAGISSDGESSASASTVGPMIGSNIGPLR